MLVKLPSNTTLPMSSLQIFTSKNWVPIFVRVQLFQFLSKNMNLYYILDNNWCSADRNDILFYQRDVLLLEPTTYTTTFFTLGSEKPFCSSYRVQSPVSRASFADYILSKCIYSHAREAFGILLNIFGVLVLEYIHINNVILPKRQQKHMKSKSYLYFFQSGQRCHPVCTYQSLK